MNHRDSVWLTIGVAIYKVGAYLPACLDSIAAQDLTGVEVILLDDGSPDDCPAICDAYAAKYPAFTAVHQPNQGVSTARNALIERARGTWLAFVDGDDMLAPDAIATYRRYADSAAEVIAFDHIEFVEGSPMPDYAPQRAAMTLTDREELARYTACALVRDAQTYKLYAGLSIPAIWAKLFRMDFLRREHIRFDPSLPKAQDTAFTFLYCHLLKRLEIIPEPVYHYRRNPGSITVRFSPDMAAYYVALMRVLQEIMARFGDDDVPVIQNSFYRLVLCQLRVVMNLGSHHPHCPWKRAQRLAYIQTYCDQPFFADALAHYDAMPADVRTWVPWKAELLAHDYDSLYRQYAAFVRRERMRKAMETHPIGKRLLALKRAVLGGAKA